ncbi:MAG: hypothetical protein HY788_22750 [Deltaproteobacteria bacterium]|nr:hypothetical protein [Deltaproteobacteria bacterium]
MNETLERPPNQASESEEVIEAGDVQGLEDELPFHEAKHRAETSRLLAVMFAWILSLSMLIHYGVTAVVMWYGKESMAETLAKIFNIWLPVISGLMGSAATYYFTKEK